MSAMVKTRPRPKARKKPTRPAPETEASRFCGTFKSFLHESEAPEMALREPEPPETREEWRSEAPDAGQGGHPSNEREFTHGRSRS